MSKNKKTLTKSQKRIFSRKLSLLELSKSGIIFCTHHSQYLEPFEIKNHRCYIGNNGKRVCPSLTIETLEGYFITYKKWASNGKNQNFIK